METPGVPPGAGFAHAQTLPLWSPQGLLNTTAPALSTMDTLPPPLLETTSVQGVLPALYVPDCQMALEAEYPDVR